MILRIIGARCFTGSMPLLTPIHTLQTYGSPEVITSTTILRNVMENQLGKARTSHPKSPNFAPLHRKWQEIQLHSLSELGECQKIPLTIGLHSVSFSKVNCQPRLTSFSYLWVYYQSSTLQDGQSTKAIKPHPTGVSLVILRQVPAVIISLWLVSRG